MKRLWPISLALAGCAPTALTVSGVDPARLFAPARLPEDARLGSPYDLDHPAQFRPAFEDRAAWEARARELREQVQVALGLWPPPEKTPIDAVIHGRIERDGYTIEKVYFASLPGHYVTGNLYRPTPGTTSGLVGGRRPAMLSPHGHSARGRFTELGDAEVDKAIASGAEKTREGARYPLLARQAMLARMGFVVFQYDMVGLADSTKLRHGVGFNDVEAELRLQSAMGLQTWNSVRALDFLASLPDVDPARIAVSGSSGGGTQTFILAAVDQRPLVSFPVVMVSTAMQGGCICENASLLRIGTNNVEIAALFAPKALGMAAADDWTRDIESKGLPELKTIYGLYHATDRVLAKHFSFPHNYNQVSRELMYGWVNRHLGTNLPEPIAERPFDPVPPAELSVFDARHPRPSDELDAAGVRRFLTVSAERQLDRLAGQPDEYRRVVGTALRVMVNDRLPAPAAVAAQSVRRIDGDGFVVQQVTLGRRGAGEQVPAVRVVPRRWDGTVVVWAHPDGKASLFDGRGRLVPTAQRLLDRHAAIAAADVFLTGEFHLPGQRTAPPSLAQKNHQEVPFAGFFYGYNRGVLANRVHDLLTVIAWAGEGARRVQLAAFDRAGVWALLARALSDGVVDRAAIDVHGFDFDRVEDVWDEMMLPGALKYGGMGGVIPLLVHGRTALFDLPDSARRRGGAGVGTTLVPGAARPEDVVAALTD